MNEIKEAYIVMKNGDRIPFELSEETKKDIMEKMSRPEKWKPETDDRYYHFNSTGGLCGAPWNNDNFDIWRYRNNMVFKTEADARKYKKVFEAICEVSEEHPVDWKNTEQEKYWMEWDFNDSISNCDYTYVYKIPNVKYASCEDFIEKVLEKGISKEELEWFLMR